MPGKQKFKLSLIAVSILALMGKITVSAAYENSQTSSLSTSSSNVTVSQPYLLDSGFVDYIQSYTVGGPTYTTSVNSNTTMWYYLGTNPLNKFCASNFVPYFVFSPVNIQQQGSNVSICVGNIKAQGPKYIAETYFSTVSSQGTTQGSNIAFMWQLFCWPIGMPYPGNGPTVNNAPTWTWNFSGSGNTINGAPSYNPCDIAGGGHTAPPFNYDNQPILWDSGAIAVAASTTAYTSFWFAISKRCPSNYTPYVNTYPTHASTTNNTVLAIQAYDVRPIGTCSIGNQTIIKFQDILYDTTGTSGHVIGFGSESTNSGGNSIGYELFCYPSGTAPAYQNNLGPQPAWKNATTGAAGGPPC